jgi:hypothetical protein
MTNRLRRSLLLSLILGDGCLHITRPVGKNAKTYGLLTVTHGLDQSDYNAWKAHLISELVGKSVKQRTHNKGNATQVSVCKRYFKAWYKFCYPNRKKDLARIIKYIEHPEFALGVWLMDDGYVEPTVQRKGVTAGTIYSACFRIFTCDQSIETQSVLINWFREKFGVEPKIRFALKRSANKKYPFLTFTCQDSLKLWKVIREDVLKIPSMRKKFRHIESVYQRRLSKPQPSAQHLKI